LYQAGAVYLYGWLHVGIAKQRFNAFANYFGAGVVLSGLIASRPDDRIGLAVGSVQTGSAWRTAQPDIQYVSSPAL
jgi:carbohydrate-selective porin OprB